MNGFCDIVIIGSEFTKQTENNFFRYSGLVMANILKREPFQTLKDKLRFTVILPKGGLGCSLSGSVGAHALTCNQDKIKRALKGQPYNLLVILDWKNGGGGGHTGQAAVGFNQNFDPWAGNPDYCDFDLETRATDGIIIHEIGHACGCDHDFVSGVNVMWYATNGGCQLVGRPFTPAHQQIITAFINKAAL